MILPSLLFSKNCPKVGCFCCTNKEWRRQIPRQLFTNYWHFFYCQTWVQILLNIWKLDYFHPGFWFKFLYFPFNLFHFDKFFLRTRSPSIWIRFRQPFYIGLIPQTCGYYHGSVQNVAIKWRQTKETILTLFAWVSTCRLLQIVSSVKKI